MKHEKGYGPAEIRTQDLRHVKATSGKNTGLESPDENSSEESGTIQEEVKNGEHSRNGGKIETIRDYYLAHKKDFIAYMKTCRLKADTITDYTGALEESKPISRPPDIGTYTQTYGVPVTSKLKRGIYKLIKYNQIRHASNDLLGYDEKLWRVQFSIVDDQEGTRSGTHIVDMTAEEIRSGYQRINPSLKTFYKFLAYTGMRGEQAYDILKSWNPSNIERFTATVDGQTVKYCRYSTEEVSRGKKNSFYAFFPAELEKELNDYTLPGSADTVLERLRRDATTDPARPINAINLRKFQNNTLQKGSAVDNHVANYIQGRRPKGVSGKYYDDLAGFAVEQYPKALHRNFGPDFFGISATTAPPKKQKEKAPSTKGTPAPAPEGSLNALWKETADGFMQYCRQNQIGIINRPKQAPYFAHVGEGNSCFRKNTILSPADFAALKGNFNKLPKSYRTALRLWIRDYLPTVGITSPAGYPAEEWIAVLTYQKN